MRLCHLRLVQNHIKTAVTNSSLPMSYQDEDRKKRSVELPVEIWDRIEQDAKRTRRSGNGVIEAILMRLYLGVDIELHGIDELRPLVSATPSEKATIDKQRKVA